MKPARFLTAFLAAGTLLTGCGGGSSHSNNPPVSVADVPATTRSQYGPLVFTLTVPKTMYSRGEVVPAVLTVTNTSSNKVSLLSGNRQAYIHVAQGDKSIYTFNGFGGASIVLYYDFLPGEVKTYPVPWGQYKDTADVNQMPSQVDIGHYQVAMGLPSGVVTEETKPYLSPSTSERSLFSPPPIDISVE